MEANRLQTAPRLAIERRLQVRGAIGDQYVGPVFQQSFATVLRVGGGEIRGSIAAARNGNELRNIRSRRRPSRPVRYPGL